MESNVFTTYLGIIENETAIGLQKQLQKQLWTVEITKLLFLAIYLSFGGYFFFLAVRRKKERENLFFALYSFGLVMYL